MFGANPRIPFIALLPAPVSDDPPVSITILFAQRVRVPVQLPANCPAAIGRTDKYVAFDFQPRHDTAIIPRSSI